MLAASANGAFNPTWTVAYDQTNATTNQLRAVEVAEQAGNNSVYVGMIQTTGSGRHVYRFNTSSPYTLVNDSGGRNDQPKTIATDDRGNVYVGDRISGGLTGQITTFSSNLGSSTSTSTNVAFEQFGGLASAHFGGHYYLYATREATPGTGGTHSGNVGAQIRRYIVDTPSSPTLDATFGTAGVYTIPGTTSAPNGSTAESLRGIDVAPDGTIFTTNRDTGAVYRISSNLTSVITKTLTRAMDVTLFSGYAFVTSYNGANSLIRVYDMGNLNFEQDITFASTGLSRGSAEGWGGIDIDQKTGRIWLGDEQYNSSGTTKDRLLVSSPLAAVPEPTAFLVLAIVGLMAPKALRRTKKLAA
jgi:hypothetical protein